MSPQVSVTVNLDKRHTKTVKDGGNAAEFNETLKFNVDCQPNDLVHIKVKHDSKFVDSCVGVFSMALEKFITKLQGKTLRLQVVDADNYKPSGFIELIPDYQGTNDPMPQATAIAKAKREAIMAAGGSVSPSSPGSPASPVSPLSVASPASPASFQSMPQPALQFPQYAQQGYYPQQQQQSPPSWGSPQQQLWSAGQSPPIVGQPQPMSPQPQQLQQQQPQYQQHQYYQPQSPQQLQQPPFFQYAQPALPPQGFQPQPLVYYQPQQPPQPLFAPASSP